MSEDFKQWEERYPLGYRVRVLAVHPAGLIALEKPVNVLSHPNSRRDKKRSLLEAHYDMKQERYVDLKEEGDELFLCHRLDSATSGVILLAQNKAMAEAVRVLFEKHRIEKQYYAIVRGKPHAMPDTWMDLLPPEAMPYGNGSRPPKPVQMRCKHQHIRSDANRLGLSLLRLIPYTGRTHQLRMQCAMRNCPVLGDKTYGDFQLNHAIARAISIKRLYLHSASLSFDFMLEGKLEKFRVESPVPHSFNQVLEQNAVLSKLPFNISRPSRPTPPNPQMRIQRPRFAPQNLKKKHSHHPHGHHHRPSPRPPQQGHDPDLV